MRMRREIWRALQARVEIIPRLKASTEGHAPISVEGYSILLSKGVHVVFPVVCHAMAQSFGSFVLTLCAAS